MRLNAGIFVAIEKPKRLHQTAANGRLHGPAESIFAGEITPRQQV